MRSFLLVAAEADALDAALESGADALVLDLGDAAHAARTAAVDFLARARGPGPALFVKVAPLGGAEIDHDLAALVAAGAHGVALPRACGGASLQHLSAKLAVAEALAGRDDGATRILAFATQTPAAIFALGDYAGASTRLDALAFNTEELRRALGAEIDDASLREPGSPFAHARAGLRLAAAAAGAAAIDRPFPAQGDPGRLAAECRAARRDGFAGKLAASSWQIREINAAFDRSEARL